VAMDLHTYAQTDRGIGRLSVHPTELKELSVTWHAYGTLEVDVCDK
jgi:hypothetical protein